MFKIKTSLIQGFATLLLTSSLVWATPNHDDDNVESFALRGMEAPALQSSAFVNTSPSTRSTSTDLSTAASDCHVTSFLAVTVSEGVIASAARQSTDLVTSDQVCPPKWSPIEDEDALANLPRLVLNEIFQWLLCTGVDNVKKAAFLNRYWHRYTQSMEFKNLFLNGIQDQVGDDSSDAPGHPGRLFKAHRTYFKTFENVRLIEFFKNSTFAGALQSYWLGRYRYDFNSTAKIASDPQAKSLCLQGSTDSWCALYSNLRLSPTVHFDLTKLIELNLSQNRLRILPDLGTMTNLQILKLSHNRFHLIPEIVHLKKLRVAELEENPLCDLPDLTLLTNLWRVGIDVSNINVLSALKTAPALEYLSATSSALTLEEIRDFMGRGKCRVELLSPPPKRSLERPGGQYY